MIGPGTASNQLRPAGRNPPEVARIVGSSGIVAVSAAEPTLPLRIRTQRAQEVDLAEVGPQRVAEVELRVRTLPKQEPTESLLAGGADDQVRVRLASGVEVLRNVLDVEQ